MEVNNPAFNEESENYNNGLSIKIRSYNEDYFIDNVLLIDMWTQSGASPEIKKLTINNGELIIHHYKYITKGSVELAVIGHTVWLIEIKKEDIEGIATVSQNYKEILK